MSNSASFNPFANIEHLSSDIPSILAASCKKVFKKDVATRLKGLYEIFNWIKASDSIDVFRDDFVLISWSESYRLYMFSLKYICNFQ